MDAGPVVGLLVELDSVEDDCEDDVWSVLAVAAVELSVELNSVGNDCEGEVTPVAVSVKAMTAIPVIKFQT